MQVLFDGKDIRVVAQLFDANPSRLVITFTGRAAKPPVDKGFGESFLEKRRIPAIHFISKDNHWWQTPEPWQAFELLRRQGLLSADREIVLYGSSMGGYAALRFSAALRPRRIVVFSPQYSIDARKVPFERRWRAYAAKLDFRYDEMRGAIDPDAQAMVIFDPLFRPDALHVRRFEEHRPLERVAIPFAGHNTARFLSEIGVMAEVTQALLDGSFDLAAFRRTYRRERQTAALFWHGLADALSEHRRPAAAAVAALVAVRVLQALPRMRDRTLQADILHAGVRAAAAARLRQAEAWLEDIRRLEGSNSRTVVSECLVARARDDTGAALRLAEAAFARRPGDAAVIALRARCLVEAGDPEAALALIEGLPAKLQDQPPVLLARGRAEAALGRWETAKTTLRRFCGLDRHDAEARFLLALSWAETGRPDAVRVQLQPTFHSAIADTRLARDTISLLYSVREERYARM
ncbi:MAG: tetratricopeptide repeat protein, partial [Elioraea sp.]|nr:tetratricopeptide repeat protein [Elioraea sp.]